MSQYAGNLTNRTITTEAQPDLIFIRDITNAGSWYVVDSSRGITANKYLTTNSTDAEATFPQSNFTSVGSTSVGMSSGTWLNSTGSTYQMWMWRLNGGTTASNTSGDINSTTQASDKTGLSIVTYTGNGSQGQTIGHGLTKAPEMVWFKNRDYGTRGVDMDWIVALSTSTGSPFASLSGSSQTLELNNSHALLAKYRTEGNFTPTTSTFNVPANGNAPYWFNGSGDDYVAYCWHSVEGFSKFGFYEGNGNADGPFIYTGFRPRMLFVKSIDTSDDWIVIDTLRSTFNTTNNGLAFNNNNAATTSNRECDIFSNGFKPRTSNTNLNKSSTTYIYGAWGDVPFKYNNTF